MNTYRVTLYLRKGADYFGQGCEKSEVKTGSVRLVEMVNGSKKTWVIEPYLSE